MMALEQTPQQYDAMRRSVRPLRSVSLLVTGALALSAASWWAGAAVSDPSGRASSTAEPIASLVTARVERRSIVETVTGRAEIGFAESYDVTAPSDAATVTALPRSVGDIVNPGSVLAEVDGRPIIALVGDAPMYRHLTVGMSGPDVAALEAGLAAMNLDPGAVDGVFDGATESAVRQMFANAGYVATEPTAEQRSAYVAAQEALTAAQLASLSAHHELERDQQGVLPVERAALDAQVAEATRALERANVAATDGVARLDAELARARRLVEGASDGATHEDVQAELDDLERSQPGAIAALLHEVAAARERLDVAVLERAEADISRDRVVLQRRAEVAEESVRLAQGRVEQQAAVVGAGVRIGEVAFIASLPQRVTDAPVEVGADASAVLLRTAGGAGVAQWFVTDAQRTQLRVGAASELVDTISGERFAGTVLSIAERPGDAPRRSPSPPSPGASEGVAASSSNDDRFLVIVALDVGGSIDSADALVGRDVQISVSVAESAVGLVVPMVSVITRADGGAVVVRAHEMDAANSGVQSADIDVELGASGDGFVLVTPHDATALGEGDRVVVDR